MVSKRARALRRNPTKAEKRLWWRLRARQIHGLQFRRQAPIGTYVVDFVCFSRKLVIEVDGRQHARRAELDAVRTAWPESQGFHVPRFWNNEALENTDGVVQTIEQVVLGRSTPSP